VRTCLFKWLLDDIADWIGREYDDVIAVGSVNRLPIESVVNLAQTQYHNRHREDLSVEYPPVYRADPTDLQAIRSRAVYWSNVMISGA